MADMKEAVEFLANVAGGGAAGYLDQKYPSKFGMTPGTIAGLALAGLGMTKYAGSFKGKCLAVGEGMLAGEAYRMVSNRVTAGAVTTVPAPATQGVRGVRGAVGALPPPQRSYSSREELMHTIQQLQGARRAA